MQVKSISQWKQTENKLTYCIILIDTFNLNIVCKQANLHTHMYDIADLNERKEKSDFFNAIII